MEVLESIFEMISRGVKEGKDDFHTMIFSNIQNNRVESRCVILRHFDKKNITLTFNTDIRSPKVEAIRKNPETHCLFYHFQEKTQLRISTYSIIHYNDELHSIGWKNTAISSRKCYLTKYAPSQSIEKMDDGIPSHLLAKIPTADESELGKSNFVVITNKIVSIDWLYLSSSGHKRARYDFNEGSINKAWLAP
jgi:pyridoxamine 5'-phosphate oxidase